MGIYIKGMDMPKNCLCCPLMVNNDGNDDCAVQSEEANAGFTDWDDMKASCPLVPVPPHGRLIDESAIDLSKYEKAAHDALHNGKGSILYNSGVLAGARAITQLVRNAPTIIEAEEGE